VAIPQLDYRPELGKYVLHPIALAFRSSAGPIIADFRATLAVAQFGESAGVQSRDGE
jgi:hypothetical protein